MYKFYYVSDGEKFAVVQVYYADGALGAAMVALDRDYPQSESVWVLQITVDSEQGSVESIVKEGKHYTRKRVEQLTRSAI